jgi:hypothetical protein
VTLGPVLSSHFQIALCDDCNSISNINGFLEELPAAFRESLAYIVGFLKALDCETTLMTFNMAIFASACDNPAKAKSLRAAGMDFIRILVENWDVSSVCSFK